MGVTACWWGRYGMVWVRRWHVVMNFWHMAAREVWGTDVEVT